MLKQKEGLLRQIIMIVVLLAAMNVFQKGTYLIFLAFGLLVIADKKIRIDTNALLLLCLSICYVLFNGLNKGSVSSSIFRIGMFPLAYIIGSSFLKIRTTKKIKNTIILLAISMSIHSIVNLFYNIIVQGNRVFRTGITIDFWSGVVSSSTGQASYYFLLIGSLAYAIFSVGEAKKRIPIIICYAVALVHDIYLGGRAFLILTGIVIIIGMLYTALLKNRQKVLMRSIGAILVVLVSIFVSYMYNFFKIRDFFESTFLHFRLFSIYAISFFEDSRMDTKFIYLRNMFHYPFGGNQLSSKLGVGYAHDLWLDLFDDAGWLAFILLWIYTIFSVIRWIQMTKVTTDKNMSLLVLGALVVLICTYFMEPILAGCPMVFAVYCFIDGMIASYLNQNDEGLLKQEDCLE